MNHYTIYCTEEQTRKALELGAPIVILPNYEEFKGFPFVRCKNGYEYPCQKPTAEQMIGWLEEEWCCSFTITKDIVGLYLYVVRDKKKNIISKQFRYNFRKEATLAAIDAALDYIKKKGNKDENYDTLLC